MITIGFVFGAIAPDKRTLPNWYAPILVVTIVTFLVGSYTITRSKIANQFSSRNSKDVKNESPPPYRLEKYILRWWKCESTASEDDPFLDFVDLPGKRSRHPNERQRKAVAKWERIKQHPNGVTLEEFLEDEFGITNGVLNVSRSTFYTWRRQLKKLAEEKQQNNNSKKG